MQLKLPISSANCILNDLLKVTSAQKMVESYKQKMAVPGYEEKVPASVREQNTMKMQAFQGGKWQGFSKTLKAVHFWAVKRKRPVFRWYEGETECDVYIKRDKILPRKKKKHIYIYICKYTYIFIYSMEIRISSLTNQDFHELVRFCLKLIHQTVGGWVGIHGYDWHPSFNHRET